MPHSTPLISTIVAGLVLAFVLGALANRLRMPPLVGYLIAGVLVGPNTPGFVGDLELATELSELGVILLMFGVGLHFSLKDLLSVRALAIPGALVQIAGATLLGLGLALLLGWSLGAGLIFGLALSVASTVVLLKTLQERHMVESEKGRIAVGWLIVEDISMVLALVLIPAIASIYGVEAAMLHDPFVAFVERFTGPLGLAGIIGVTVVKLAAFVGFMLVVGRRVIPFVLHYTAHTGSRELFRLAVLAIALGVAAGAAYLFGVSLALGAFFAGMILSESELSHRAANESLPLRDAFAVLFFVAVGMLFDPSILLTDPLPVLATVLIIMVGKSAFSFLIVLAFRQPVATALTISASLAQIGEFSFILAALGVGLGILPPEGRDLILSGSIISIILNPLIFMALDAVRPRLEQQFGAVPPELPADVRTEPGFAPSAAPAAEAVSEEELAQATTRTGHIVLVGYGRVGTVVAEALLERHASFLVVEDAEARVNAARARGIEVIVGNAAGSRVLNLANADMAATVIVTIPNAFEAGQAVEQTRRQNPKALIVARAHSDEEEEYLKGIGADVVILGEREIAMGMVEVVNRDPSALAAITAADAVESVLGPMAATPAAEEPDRPSPRLIPDANLLAEAIEAAHIQHPDVGPAEPPYVVPSLGEEPDAVAEDGHPVSEVVEMTPEQRLAPLVPTTPRAATPATRAGDPFNPEVPPPVEEKV
jgi:CPA2 family monovalent cation:H+ antiporter-2